MNNEIRKDAKVLIISWSPVPTPKYQKIEGSGQRFFGLATGLQKNGIKDITIAIGGIYPLDVDEVSGFKLFNYDLDNDFAERLSEYDTIIFNYTIHGSAFIVQHLPQRTQVIVDGYGPAYIENLARDPDDLPGTYVGNLAAVNDVFNKVLPRADYILYANDAQEKLYTGVLTALGSINQFSYKTDKLLKVPFGIDTPDSKASYDNPYLEYGFKKSDFVLLWFGGLYPWFDITGILDVIKGNEDKKIKFVIVGGNNPQNQHPDFVRHYKDTVKYITENKLEDRVQLVDWVDFATRRKYYEHADAIISMNSEGKEIIYSWRTRVMDYVGSTTPLITNGGDPLSEELIEIGAAFRIDSHHKESIKRTLNELLNDRNKLKAASNKMRAIQPKYYWENVTKVLAEKIRTQSKPYSDERMFRLQNNITDIALYAPPSAPQKRSYKSLALKAVRKTREKGLRTTYTIAKDKIRRRLEVEYRKRFPKTENPRPRIVVVSNQLNNTGGPFVIMDVIRKLIQEKPSFAKRVKFIAFTPIEAENVRKLENDGIGVEVYTNRELNLELNSGDVVILNTFAVSRTTIFSVIHAINQNKVGKVFWYGHEASPEGFIDEDVKKIFIDYLERNIAKVYSVSEKTRQEYVKFFGTSKNIEKMPYSFSFPKEYFKICKPEEFDELRFVATGSLMDMRKGQYPILYAFLDLYHNRYKKNPEQYRKFHVEFIGAYEKSDLGPQAAYHVKNIKRQFDLSAQGLESHVSVYPTMSHDKALQKITGANITICYSLYEALPMFVYEGMAAGHPIIRNESAGQEEQLVEGKNGYAVSSGDFAGLVDTLECLLNKKTTSNKELAQMSEVSNRIAHRATQSKYQMIGDIVEAFGAND